MKAAAQPSGALYPMLAGLEAQVGDDAGQVTDLGYEVLR